MKLIAFALYIDSFEYDDDHDDVCSKIYLSKKERNLKGNYSRINECKRTYRRKFIYFVLAPL
jgi:hypothetical protein